MQLGAILLMMFSGYEYSVDRLIFLAVNVTGVIIGITFEEKRLVKKFSGYAAYMNKVRCRLIPFVI